tara:strand:+ start:436 stop:951 length:516 start_codon:yes stop_codon:yes gene_type:complete
MPKFILYPKIVNDFDSCTSTSKIILGNFIRKIIDDSNFSQAEITLATIYLKRYTVEENIITKSNINILFAISLYVATKWHEDYDLNIIKVACLFGVTKDEIINLESEFLHRINWNLYVSESEFNCKVEYYSKIYEKLKSTNSFLKTKKDRYVFIIESEIEKLIYKKRYCCF